MTTPTILPIVDMIAQELAEHIAAHPMDPDFKRMLYGGDRRRPEGVSEIKAELLAGNVWVSWLDETVSAGLDRMREAERPCVNHMIPGCTAGICQPEETP